MAISAPDIANPADGVDINGMNPNQLLEFQIKMQEYNFKMTMWSSIIEADANAKKAVANKVS